LPTLKHQRKRVAFFAARVAERESESQVVAEVAASCSDAEGYRLLAVAVAVDEVAAAKARSADAVTVIFSFSVYLPTLKHQRKRGSRHIYRLLMQVAASQAQAACR
jgi:hypothetical protein